MNPKRVFSGAPWEAEVGYCRAVRVGRQIWVTGTAPVEEDGTVHRPGDARAQARRCLDIIRRALEELGSSLADVVRTRMYVTDIRLWREFGDAHREAFGERPPATTMVQVSALIDPEMLIEIEAEAILQEGTPAEGGYRRRSGLNS